MPTDATFLFLSAGGDIVGRAAATPAVKGERPAGPLTTPSPTKDGEDPSKSSESKKCNCKKSKCLKLYCECFAADGEWTCGATHVPHRLVPTFFSSWFFE
mgnify:CR=1 FL=1